MQPNEQGAIDILKRVEAELMPSVLASSFSAEDMVLIDLVSKFAPDIEIFTLDTGRLNPETHDLITNVRTKYTLEIKVFFPGASEVEAFVNQHGPNAFYEGVGLRKTCCAIRKVAPLGRALKRKKSWITGLRREQSSSRQEISLMEWDEQNNLYKVNPLTDWTYQNVWEYIHRYDVPYNSLHDEGYASIGCAPCTRSISEGEDIRAGRWWWEEEGVKECGLHPAAKSA